MLEAFFTSLLILVCVGVLAFTGLAVKKLYQGQRWPYPGCPTASNAGPGPPAPTLTPTDRLSCS